MEDNPQADLPAPSEQGIDIHFPILLVRIEKCSETSECSVKPKQQALIQKTNEIENAFNNAKEALTNPRTLQKRESYHFRRRLLCTNEGSCIVILLQTQKRQEIPHPIAYESQKLTETEKLYSARERGRILAAKYGFIACVIF